MNEKSPDFKVEIPSNASASPRPKPVKKPRRKVHRSVVGTLYTVLHILGQLTALGVAGWALYCYIENDINLEEHYILGHLRWLTGLPEHFKLSQEENQWKFIVGALSCITLGSILQLLVVWLAYFSPGFLVKNPSLWTFWPMALSFFLRVAYEALLQLTETERDYTVSILWISLSLAYCVLVVDGYWYDDEDPPKIFGLKPWYVEPLETELPQ